MSDRAPLTLRREGDLLWAALDEPERANALSPALVAALTALYSRPLLDEGVRAVVLTGAGRH
ncbi:MAG TPA: enoyl-CoA hydratase, partial [Thermoanaerobaculia bacterium]|nr:enoyl-CoA hydratase [Thermoanaerobaculia bacterium]